MLLMVLGGIILLAIGYLARKFLAGMKVERAEARAKRTIAEAEKEAEARKREVGLEAKDELYRVANQYLVITAAEKACGDFNCRNQSR